MIWGFVTIVSDALRRTRSSGLETVVSRQNPAAFWLVPPFDV